ncbi:MAG: dethiobiotin synthase [Desulfobacterales bacterium]|jgi:dethiobiotin synthase|nr:dethiobiotin synthase [Desulfobacterales bacterium]
MPDSFFPREFFVTGTDTGVGKTLVCAILIKGLAAAYWKPVQSGVEETTDTEWLQAVTGLPKSHFMPESYRLTKPLSPHAAAEFDGIRICLDSLNLPQANEFPHLIVEGAGGVMAPINESKFMKDLIKHLNIPVLLVSRSTLGTINHTLLSLQCLRQAGLEVLGVVMNGPQNLINRRAIEFYGKVTVCAEIDIIPAITPHVLLESFAKYFHVI